MTASLLNLAALPGTAPVAQAGVAQPNGGTPDAGQAFEAMMTAFLGQITASDEAVAATPAQAPVAAVAATPITGQPLLLAVEGEEVDADETAAGDAVSDPAAAIVALEVNAAVLAALAEAPMAAAPLAAQPQAAAAADAETVAADASAKSPTPMAVAQAKTPGLPGPRTVGHAAAPATIGDDLAEIDPEAEPALAADDAEAVSVKPEAAPLVRPQAPAPQARAAAPTAATQPTQAQAPTAAADLDVAAFAAAAEPVTATPAAPAAETAQASTATTSAPATATAKAAETAAPLSRAEKVETRSDKGSARVEAFAAAEAGATAAKPGAAPVNAKGDAAKASVDKPKDGVELAKADPAAAPTTAADSVEAPAAPEATVAAAERPAHAASTAQHAAAAQVRGAPETVANLSAQILKKLDARSTRFDVELTPEGLGKVDVRVEIGAHGKMTAALSFETPQAAQELKSRANELQKAMEQAGFDLSGGMSFDVAGDQGRPNHGFLGDQGQQADTGAAFRGRAFRAALDTADQADVAAGPLKLRRGVTAGLDVRI